MDSEGYLIVFPVYLVVFPSRNNVPLACVDPTDPSKKDSIALFTEHLLAERARDEQPIYGEIVEIGTGTELETRYYPLFKANGFFYVTIDRHEQTGIGVRIPIDG